MTVPAALASYVDDDEDLDSMTIDYGSAVKEGEATDEKEESTVASASSTETDLLKPPSQPSSRPPSDLRPSPSEVSVKPRGLVSYGDDDETDEDDSDLELDSDIPLSKDPSGSEFESVIAASSAGSGSPSSLIDTEIKEPSTSSSTVSARYADVRLPPEPQGRCSKSLQEKIARMIDKQEREGWNLNEHVQRKKEFRNPSIYEKLISYIGIEEHGTNYPKHLYDPSIWGPESFYDSLAKTQKEYHDKKEKEKAKRAHVEFISGVKKPPTSSSSTITSASAAGASASAVAVATEKRSKWDMGPPSRPK